MASTPNPYIKAGVEVVHDIAAGSFPGAALAAWMIRRQLETTSPDAVAMLEQASRSLWLILVGALLALAATGALRLGYWKLNLKPELRVAKARMIQLKHWAFVIVLMGSSALMFTLMPR